MILFTKRKKMTRVFLLAGISTLLVFSGICFAQDPAKDAMSVTLPQKLSLKVNQHITFETKKPVKRVAISTPQIADAAVVSPSHIYIIGKAPGTTTLSVWEDGKVPAFYEVEVSPHITQLKEKIYEILGEKNVNVIYANDTITLSGSVSSTEKLPKVLAIVKSYIPGADEAKEGKIINLLDVSGVQQVMLEVRVAEMSRSLSRRLGINYNYISTSGQNFGLNLLNRLTMLPQGGFPANSIEVAESVNAIFRFFGEGATWTVFIDALKENGLAKVMAEPTLITMSGQSANFLAGGEFPIPVPQERGVVTIDYKTFGVGLSFFPTVLSNGRINMKVAPEVSELDFSNAVFLSGFVVPGITTRRASTVIELADGQSFAIAGLLQDNIREVVTKFPVLGDIPVLGALFKSTNFKKNETELVIIVTPHLVKPLDMKKQPLPTDQYFEPSDAEFYLFGAMEALGNREHNAEKMPVSAPAAKKGMEGGFGYIVP